ncbi:MAG TPA: ABC transporter permease subunit [Bryobacteraceae bacterium]|nr:ABC transporter permease subunit [Bryobacteraceae bacterium]
MRPSASIALALSPVLLVIVPLFIGGLLLAAAGSLGFFPPTGESAFTLRHYTALASDKEFGYSLLMSFGLAAVSTVLSAAGGLWLALSLRELALRSRAVHTLLQIPIAIPHLAAAVALIHFISPSGLIARIAFAAGVIDAPAGFPALINDRFGFGIVLVYVLKESPFVAAMTLALLARTGHDYEAVASTLGATAGQRLRYVTLPLVAPAAISASLIVFAFTFGAFDVPFLLGRQYPAMLGVVAQQRYGSLDLADRPAAIAIAVLMTAVTALLAWMYLKAAHAAVGVERPTLF